jgi:four helix bundle protein
MPDHTHGGSFRIAVAQLGAGTRDEGEGQKRMAVGGFEDLIVWQKRFGLTSQMRRAAVSIPSNIAEGQARHTTKEYVLFVSNAEGSVAELQTQMRIAIELGYCSFEATNVAIGQAAEVRKMLNALRRELNARITHT